MEAWLVSRALFFYKNKAYYMDAHSHVVNMSHATMLGARVLHAKLFKSALGRNDCLLVAES